MRVGSTMLSSAEGSEGWGLMGDEWGGSEGLLRVAPSYEMVMVMVMMRVRVMSGRVMGDREGRQHDPVLDQQGRVVVSE